MPTEKDRPKVVVLVESDESLRELMKRFLADEHYSVFLESDGKAGLWHFKHFSGPIDLLIADVVLPDQTGVSLADLVKHEGIEKYLGSGMIRGIGPRFALDTDGRILVSKHARGGPRTRRWLTRVSGKRLHLPNDPGDRPENSYVAWHGREVFRKPAVWLADP